MGLTPFINPNAKNKFCSLKNLRNESDVEQFFIKPLLEELGYTEDYLKTKTTIKAANIGKKKKSKPYIPDFIAYTDKAKEKPVLIVDAKNPTEDPEDGVADAQLYASVIRRSLSDPKPEQYCIGSNGLTTLLMHYDSSHVELSLNFDDFVDGTSSFEKLKSTMSREERAKAIKPKEEQFEFKKPPVSDLISIFEACHNLIWRKEKIPPAEAFYEFAKLLFVKSRSDREIHNKMEKGAVSASDFIFSVRWIESLEVTTPDPINSVLFTELRKKLEEEIAAGLKKRMFEHDEMINLGASTIKEVVRLLEHHDLYAMDEDLNGRMFETFLTAVIRGRSLGQFFTPRTVVKFMVDMANLSVKDNMIPRVMDACCGTSGFLIEVMAVLTDSIMSNPALSEEEKRKMVTQLQKESLWGIEANETIARIARINMYLHQDGGSRIYKADSLDKELVRDPNIVGEAKRDFEELRKVLLEDKLQFDLVFTNPPFAMRYERKKKDERRILAQYQVAYTSSNKLVSSLKSSVMFFERYYDILKPHGAMFIIIDEAFLNTTVAKYIRDWLRRRFLIRAVISLPKNCFVQAGSSAKTSILVLEKKSEPSDDQPSVFMAKSKSVGHTDSGKPDLSSSDLSSILAEWNRYRINGTLPRSSNCFVVKPSALGARLDVQWYDPEYEEVYKVLMSTAHVKLGDLTLTLRYGASIDADYKSDIPFIRIENLRRNALDVSDLQYVPSAVYSKSVRNLYLQEGDILIARSGTYVGLAAAVPAGFEKFIYGSYIIRLRLKDRNDFLPKFLGIYLNSRFGQMQFDRLKTGSLQFNINRNQIKDILVPRLSEPDQRKIIDSFEQKHGEITRLRQEAQSMESELSEELVGKVSGAAGIRVGLKLRDFLGE
jgi:type I restriction enzyme M protein